MSGINNPLIKNTGNSVDVFSKLVSGIISVFLILAVLYFLFFFMTGALTYLSAGGDDKKVQTAKTQLTNSLIGLAIIFFVFAILQLLGNFFGIKDIFSLNLPNLR